MIRELAKQLAEAAYNLNLTAKIKEANTTPDSVLALLNLNQIQALEIIHGIPGISQKELAEKLHITSASVSIALKTMIEAGLVERQINLADKRASQLHLTEKGHHAVGEMLEWRIQASIQFLSLLSPEEQQVFVALYQKAAQAAASINEHV